MQHYIAKDPDLGLVIVLALRYALPRHTYITSVISDFIRRWWSHRAVRKYHNIILTDLHGHLQDVARWEQQHGKETETEAMDTRTWQKLFNDLSANLRQN